MNKFDDRYEIRLANIADKPYIMNFIKDEWKKDHILATNEDFFDYEFREEERLNFVVAYEKQTSALAGIIGYNKASNDNNYLDIWGVMWKVSERLKPMNFLGIELMKRLNEYTNCRAEIGVGANIRTSVPLLKIMLHYNVYKMDHYYRISDRQNYIVATIVNKIIYPDNLKEKCQLIKLNNIEETKEVFDFENGKDMIPYKNDWYVNKRFFKHPVYEYHVWGVQENNAVTAILVTREVEYSNTKILRIIDYIGKKSSFAGLYNEFQCMLSEYEYIDCYCYGMDDGLMQSAGFVKKEENDLNIIPNYFEPFVRENIDIWVNCSVQQCSFFKGDGDQDRPNILT